jgi:hypothetical protein
MLEAADLDAGTECGPQREDGGSSSSGTGSALLCHHPLRTGHTLKRAAASPLFSASGQLSGAAAFMWL